MTDIAPLIDLILPEVEALGLSLVRVVWIGKDEELTLQVMAERPDTRQLGIEECAELSRRISDKFDELDPIEEAYRLEVSSPGIDRPLTRLRDFADWAGHEAKIYFAEKLDGRVQLRGDLAGVDGDMIIVDHPSGTFRFPFSQVGKAKLVLTDRLIAATAPIMTDGVDAFDEVNPEDEEKD